MSEKKTLNVFVQFPLEHKTYLSLSLFSVYHVKRENKYVTAKERPREPNMLYAFVRTKSGTGKLVTKHGEFLLKSDALALFDVNEILEYCCVGEEPWVYYWYNFTPFNSIPFFKRNTVYSLPFTSDEEYLNENILAIENTDQTTSILLASTMFLQLLYRWIYLLESAGKKITPHYSEITGVITYINSNLEQKFNVKDLAKMCYLSDRQFRANFKARFGVSPKTYICNQRLKKIAYLLITTTYSIKLLADKFNYDSPYQLSKEFKKMYGISPSFYRKNPPLWK